MGYANDDKLYLDVYFSRHVVRLVRYLQAHFMKKREMIMHYTTKCIALQSVKMISYFVINLLVNLHGLFCMLLNRGFKDLLKENLNEVEK